AAFTELFHFISSELVKAKQLGKVPHFYFGETHVDRGSSVYNLMVLYIAKHLGFKKIGIENELEDRILPNGARRPGRYNWGKIAAENAKLTDTFPAAETMAHRELLQNRQSFIRLAMTLFRCGGVFPTDLYVPADEWSVESVLDKRRKYPLRQIRENTDRKSPV